MTSVWLHLRMALRNIVRQKRRAVAALGAVAFGVIAYVLAGGFIEWIFWAMREDTIHSHLAHIQIVRPGYFDSGLAEPFSYLLPQEAAPQPIQTLPAVKLVTPRLSVSGLISHGEATISFIADGVSPEADELLSRTLVITSGRGLSSQEPNGFILGQGLAQNLGAKVGDKVVLLANTRGGGINAVEGYVRGLFTTVTKAYDDSALRLPLATAQQLVRTDGVHRWLVLLKDTADTGPVLAQLRQQLTGQPFQVVPWYDLADFYNKTVTLFSRQVSVMKFIIAAIIVLSISNTLIMAVMERTGEIGTMMAMGNTRRDVLRLFLSEGALLGLIGGIVGLGVGVLLAHAISAVGIPMPPPPGMARGFTGGILVSVPLGVDALALAFVATLLASVYPAWRASRMAVVDALRHNR
jgi:putative ABC transport system permease protein